MFVITIKFLNEGRWASTKRGQMIISVKCGLLSVSNTSIFILKGSKIIYQCKSKFFIKIQICHLTRCLSSFVPGVLVYCREEVCKFLTSLRSLQLLVYSQLFKCINVAFVYLRKWQFFGKIVTKIVKARNFWPFAF